MATDDLSDKPKIDQIGAALAACEANIRNHSRANLYVLWGVVGILFLLCIFAVAYAEQEGKVNRMEWRQAVSDLLKEEERQKSLEEQITSSESMVEHYKLELANLESDLATRDDGPTRDDTENINRHKSDIAREQTSIDAHKKALEEHKPVLAAAQKRVDDVEKAATPILPTQFVIGFCALAGVVIAVFASLYRGHFQEIARNQHFINGLQRILIAARYGRNAGYQTEVRRALATGAFDFDTGGLLGRGKKIENPVPGHPMYEMATAIINKALEQALERIDPAEKQESK